ncbi:histone acetyltransferase p300-like [Drosophila obscura]|uniref:histone acetyltransferase p300-like n=1 Tax=Drosophila obscura TaxID=7282 RepID=UPI001BB1CA3D|nr:histone acetyltransferase p300-like [Drosophila obscura]
MSENSDKPPTKRVKMDPSSGAGTSQQQQGIQGVVGAAEAVAAAVGGGAGGSQDKRQDVPEDCRCQIQKQYMLLQHAHKCNREVCNVTCCKAMKAELAHVKQSKDCKQGKDCTMLYCFSLRQQARHYKNCTNSTCTFCSPLRQKANVGGGAGSDATLGGGPHAPHTDSV